MINHKQNNTKYKTLLIKIMAINKIFSLKSSHLKKFIKTIILKTKCKININLRKYFETCYINSYINQFY